MFKKLSEWFDKKVAPPTLDEIVAQEVEATTLELMQISHTIVVKRYLKHMAQRKLLALQEWNAMNVQPDHEENPMK